MKKISTLFFGLSALSMCLSTAEESAAIVGAEPGQWTMDFEAAKKVAAEKDLPIIMNFTGSDWCHWCIHMDKEVFAKDGWKTYAKDNAVLVLLDFPRDPMKVPKRYKEQNEKLKNTYQVQGFPTYFVLDSDGETVLGKLGASQSASPEQFISSFQKATRLSKRGIANFIAANPDKADSFKAAIAEFKAVEKDFSAWIATSPEQSEENNQKFASFQKRFTDAKAAIAAFD